MGVFAFVTAIECIVVPVVALFFHVELPDVIGSLACVMRLGTVGVAAAGTLFGAMTVRTQARDLVLATVLFPLLSPALLSGVAATREIFALAQSMHPPGAVEQLGEVQRLPGAAGDLRRRGGRGGDRVLRGAGGRVTALPELPAGSPPPPPRTSRLERRPGRPRRSRTRRRGSSLAPPGDEPPRRVDEARARLLAQLVGRRAGRVDDERVRLEVAARRPPRPRLTPLTRALPSAADGHAVHDLDAAHASPAPRSPRARTPPPPRSAPGATQTTTRSPTITPRASSHPAARALRTPGTSFPSNARTPSWAPGASTSARAVDDLRPFDARDEQVVAVERRRGRAEAKA